MLYKALSVVAVILLTLPLVEGSPLLAKRKTFRSICSSESTVPKCCAVPVVGQGVLCIDPVQTSGGSGGGNGNPGGNNPGGNNPGGNNPGGNNLIGNNPGGNNPENGGNYNPCPSGLYHNPQCCSTDVLGFADLDCQNPSETPDSY